LVLAASSLISPVEAGEHHGMRCGTKLVELGETPGEVSAKCGAPSSASSRMEPRMLGNAVVYLAIDEWTYRGGAGDFARLLTFENARLASVLARSK